MVSGRCQGRRVCLPIVNLAGLSRFATRGVILSALLLGVGLIAAGAAALFWFSPSGQVHEAPAAALTWIPGPTNTPPLPTSTLSLLPTATPPSEALEPGETGIGSFVQITGTEGAGLNIRIAPGLSTDIQFLAYDAEVFEVRDGPQQADGFTWWYIVTPVDASRAGWAAADYLSVVANP